MGLCFLWVYYIEQENDIIFLLILFWLKGNWFAQWRQTRKCGGETETIPKTFTVSLSLVHLKESLLNESQRHNLTVVSVFQTSITGPLMTPGSESGLTACVCDWSETKPRERLKWRNSQIPNDKTYCTLHIRLMLQTLYRSHTTQISK